MSKQRPKRQNVVPRDAGRVPVDHTAGIALCQRILRSLTGVMIGAFVAIVALTTISAGELVQVLGRGLYFMILAAAVVSLGVWGVRIRLEREMGKESGVAAEVVKRT